MAQKMLKCVEYWYQGWEPLVKITTITLKPLMNVSISAGMRAAEWVALCFGSSQETVKLLSGFSMPAWGPKV